MVLIDGEPIRKKARKNYDKVLRDLEKCKTEIERFEEEDQPGFSRWLNATFGALITEAREMHQRLAQAKALVSEVQQEHFFGGHRSIHQAYKTVMNRIEEEKNAPPPEPPNPGSQKDSAETEEEFWAKNEEAFRDFASSLGFDIDDEEFGPPPAREPERSPRIKDLYRALVRRLHPDKLKNLSPKEIEWWHQAQAAYAAGNVEEMEMILTLCEIEDRGTKETSVSLLGHLVAHFKISLRSLKRRLTECKRDPAWNFARLSDRSDLHRRAEQTFKAQRELVQLELVHYEALLEKWKLQAARPQSGHRRPRSRHFEEEFFF